MKRLTLILMLALVAVSCGGKKQQPLSADEIYHERATGVVMVLNHYCFKVTMPDGKVYYWAENYDNRGFFADNLNDIAEYRDERIGTGFFISENGKIITDINILEPNNDDAHTKLKSIFSDFCRVNLDEANKSLLATGEELKRIETRIASAEFWGQDPSAKDIAERDRLTTVYNNSEIAVQKWENMSFDNVKLNIINDLRIAYNNSTITNLNDLEEAEWLEEETFYEDNQAIIQLKSRAPIPNTHIFAIDYEGKGSFVEAGRPVYMIYFIAEYDVLTPIKAKLATGKAIEKQNEISYTLPVPEMRGAPVLDEFGNLIQK